MIAFSGLDGAGKSTQIEKLRIFFSIKGKKIEVFWSRGGYTPGMEFLKKIVRKKKSGFVLPQPGKTKEREMAFENPVVRKLWLSLAITDLFLFYAIVLRFKSLFKIIICDRYVFDTQLDFGLNFPQENISNWWLWKLLKITALKPKHHFVLTIPVKESQRRSKLKNEPFPDSDDILEYRLNRYLEYCSQNSYMHHIDGTRPVEVVEKEIINLLQV